MKSISILITQLAILTVLAGCMTLDQLDCGGGQIAKYDGNKWRCSADAIAAASGATQGILWIRHHDMVVSDTAPVTLSNNGTVLFVKPKNIGTFPWKSMQSIHVPTIPPGHHITGLRVCYGIVGDQAATEVGHLRLTQFQAGGSTTGNWPGYLIRLEDATVGSQAPNPPAGGFGYNDEAGFVCVNSSHIQWQPCLDQSNGTVGAGVSFQFGDADDHIAIMAIGLQYDTACTPN